MSSDNVVMSYRWEEPGQSRLVNASQHRLSPWHNKEVLYGTNLKFCVPPFVISRQSMSNLVIGLETAMSIEQSALLKSFIPVSIRITDVKVYRRRCASLMARCRLLINVLSEDAGVPETNRDSVDEAGSMLLDIREKVEKWAKLNTWRSIIQQEEINEELDHLQRSVEVSIAAYHIKTNRELKRSIAERAVAAEQDHCELMDLIQTFNDQPGESLENLGGLVADAVASLRQETHDASAHPPPVEEIPRTANHSEEIASPEFSTLSATESEIDDSIKSLTNVTVPPPNFVCGSNNYSLIASASQSHPQPKSNVGSFIRSLALSPLLRSIFIRSTPMSLPSSLDLPTSPPPNSDQSSISARRLDRGPSVEPSGSISNHYNTQAESTIVHPDDQLIEALQTDKYMCMCGGDTLQGATLMGWLDYLFVNPEDTIQHDIFFIGHVAFVSPRDLITKLRSRLNDNAEHIFLRVVILRFIRDWLKNENLIIPSTILFTMEDIASNAEEGGDQRYLKTLAIDIRKLISVKAQPSIPSYPMAVANRNVHPPPEELAASLTFLEGETHRLVLAAEYIAYAAGHQDESPNLHQAIMFNTSITTWVKFSVLELNKVDERAKMMSSFVQTAKKCYEFGNFSSLHAILVALGSDGVGCLSGTRNSMRPGDREKLQGLIRLFKRDFKCKKAPKQSIPSSYAKLLKIKAILAHEKNVVQHPRFPTPALINIDKWDHLRGMAMSALCSRDLPAECTAQRLEFNAYIQEGIRRATVDRQICHTLQAKRKEEEEEEEDVMMTTAPSGMLRAGFTPPRQTG